jgi:hypothetical protein
MRMRKEKIILCALILLTLVMQLNDCHASGSLQNSLVKGLRAPTVISYKEIIINGNVYLLEILDEAYLSLPRIRIYKHLGNARFLEIYENQGAGEQLLQSDILYGSNKDDVAVVLIWRCGQIGLQCIQGVGWDYKKKIFKEQLIAQGNEVCIERINSKQIVKVKNQLGDKVKVLKYVWKQNSFSSE